MPPAVLARERGDVPTPTPALSSAGASIGKTLALHRRHARGVGRFAGEGAAPKKRRVLRRQHAALAMQCGTEADRRWLTQQGRVRVSPYTLGSGPE